jgi:hypothetical protein
MSSEADGGSTYNWTTLRYLVDAQREITVPLGVILWSEEVPTADGYDGVPDAQARTYLELTRDKLEGWRQLGELPYQTEPHPPLSEGWWEQVRRLLQWRVRLGSIHWLVWRDPEADLEQLYQAFVQPLPVNSKPATWPEAVPAAPAAE